MNFQIYFADKSLLKDEVNIPNTFFLQITIHIAP